MATNVRQIAKGLAMGYVSKSVEQIEQDQANIEALTNQVKRVLWPFSACYFEGCDFSSVYLRLESPVGNWSMKIRVSDHENTTNNCDYAEPDINLVTCYEYTDEYIWRAVRKAFWKNHN